MLARWNSVLTLLGLAAWLTACAGPRLATDGVVQVSDSSSLPPPSAADARLAKRPYAIGPLDKLDISVFGVEEMQLKEIETDASGNIAFPLIGSVEAIGLTPGELAAEIERRLKGRFVREPQVTVNLHETVSQIVTVDGQVLKPGLYPVISNMTLSGAVASAGGLGQYASLKDVVVFRTVSGKRMAALYNLSAIRQGRYEDPNIYPNDVVVVGDSPQRRLFDKLIQAAGVIATPIVVLLQN